MSYRPPFTTAGIVAGYLLVLVGPSFYLRRRIGAGRWCKLHRLSAVIWMLSVMHTLGARSDATALWLRAVVLAPVAPIAYLLVLRVARDQPARGSNQRGPPLAPERRDPIADSGGPTATSGSVGYRA